MPNSPITHDDNGSEIPFVKGDWVSATRTRNYVSKDTLLDWLDIHGKEKQFRKDAVRKDYDVNLDFTKFLFKQGPVHGSLQQHCIYT